MKTLMDEKIKIVLDGYNKEKEIITERLTKLSDYNEVIMQRSMLEDRLKQIDECIKEILNK